MGQRAPRSGSWTPGRGAGMTSNVQKGGRAPGGYAPPTPYRGDARGNPNSPQYNPQFGKEGYIGTMDFRTDRPSTQIREAMPEAPMPGQAPAPAPMGGPAPTPAAPPTASVQPPPAAPAPAPVPAKFAQPAADFLRRPKTPRGGFQ